jgi:NADPH:quinone reductase-like Zn-dependent oxidoreductase
LPKTGGFAALLAAETDVPRPARRQVLVRMRAASLNYRDLLVAKGSIPRGVGPAHLVPLSDGAGEVVETGPDVTRFRVGERVAGIVMQSWLSGTIGLRDRASTLGSAIDGVLAEYVRFEEDGLVALPQHLTHEEAACLPCAALTAWQALFCDRPLRPGQSVLLQGLGGVAVFALQFAHAAGARVIVMSASRARLDHALALGAAEVVNYAETPEWQESVLTLTGGRGVDHVLELGGPGTLQRSLQACRVGGVVHLIGTPDGETIDPAAILSRELTLHGVFAGSREMFEAMNRAIAYLALQPEIDRAFPFAETRAAYRHLESQLNVGKVVIRFD